VVLVVTVCESDPELPVTDRGTNPEAAAAFAATTIVCEEAAGVSVKVAGLAVTPAGSPARATFTALENPLLGARETEMVCEEFGVTVRSGGMASEKPGVAAGAGFELLPLALPPLALPLDPLPPQPTIANTAASKPK
jgi:hypothetical protein